MFAEMLGQPAASLRYDLWLNPMSDQSLRLSLKGHKILAGDLSLRTYKFEVSSVLVNKHLLMLERHFQGMYYLIGVSKIIVYDEQEASMLALMNGDLIAYLENLENNM